MQRKSHSRPSSPPGRAASTCQPLGVYGEQGLRIVRKEGLIREFPHPPATRWLWNQLLVSTHGFTHPENTPSRQGAGSVPASQTRPRRLRKVIPQSCSREGPNLGPGVREAPAPNTHGASRWQCPVTHTDARPAALAQTLRPGSLCQLVHQDARARGPSPRHSGAVPCRDSLGFAQPAPTALASAGPGSAGCA